MAYVFGMDNVPVFEMLFIMMGLQIFALAFLFIEIRKLVALIAKEKTDISRFEQDLAQFERDEGKKPPQELVNVVKVAQSRGITEEQIHKSLSEQGWEHHEIKGMLRS